VIYSNYKAAHHLDKISNLRRGEPIWPTQVQIDLTNACNHRCPYCFYRCARNKYLNATFNEKDFIPYDHIKKLLAEFVTYGIPAVQYTGGGEPLMHPEFYSIIEETIRHNIEYALVTNGSAIKLKHINLFKKATWIRISLDAISPEVYKISHGCSGDDLSHVFNVINTIVSECPDVTLGISFVVNPINYREFVEATRIMRDLGVDNIRLSVAYTPRGIDLYKDIWSEIETLAHRAKELETRYFKVFNLINPHLENLDLCQKGYSFCGYQHFTSVIGADLEVYPCCTLKYNSLSELGNLKDKSFYDIWVGPAREAWLKRDHLKEVCDKNPCWMDSKNKFISYLINQKPPHVNYI
jgi:MoaA/NifB/PqqE/SkfB family radical SAM enzyme